MRKVFRIVVFAVVLCLPSMAMAQLVLGKPIRIVVPFSPGGAPDMMARLVGQTMSGNLGLPVVIENRDGAGGRIGAESVARAAPDGHTLLLGTTSTHTSVVFLVRDLAYDPVKDFTPIINAVEAVHVLVVNSSVPVKTAQQLIDYARRNPGKLSYGTQGVGSYYHLTGELVKTTEKVEMLHVPFKGVAPAIAALLAGEINVMYAPVGLMVPHAQAGKVTMLGLIRPFNQMPKVPQLSDALKNFQPLPGWLGFLGPAGMTPGLVDRLNFELGRALRNQEVSAKLSEAGLVVMAGTPIQFSVDIRASLLAYERVVKAAGIQPE